MISAFVAQAHNRVIGKSNDLPWYLPSDLKRFKELTTGHTVIMGRKTFESILARIGKPLPNRRSIVVTRDKHFDAKGAEVAHSIEEALRLCQNNSEVFIAGGAQIYAAALPFTDRIYVTEVDADIDGDTYFPELSPEDWQEILREPHQKDDKNQYNYTYVILDKVNNKIAEI